MTNQEILVALKIDLGITVNHYDSRLEQIIIAAEKEITAAGVTIPMDEELQTITDAAISQLVIIYAGWLWRRRDTGAAMPGMVRRALNNAVFGQHMETSSEG